MNIEDLPDEERAYVQKIKSTHAILVECISLNGIDSNLAISAMLSYIVNALRQGGLSYEEIRQTFIDIPKKIIEERA